MKTTSQINVHELLNYPNLPDGYALVIDTECFACSISTMAYTANALINLGVSGWHKDKDVGAFICTYDEFKDKHPEYFI